MNALTGADIAGATLAASVPPADIPVPSQADWVAARKTAVTPGGLTMAYVEMGAGTGVPALLLHGFSDSSRSWSLLAPHLAGRRLVALDLRGHGGSDAPEGGYDVDSLAQDVAGFMALMGIGKADVVGHSLGSLTAAVLAADHPDRVNRLVLISTVLAVPAEVSAWLSAQVQALPERIDPKGQFMRDWYQNPNPVPDDFLDRMRTDSAAMPRQVWHGVVSGQATTDLTRNAARISAPTLILWGDRDGLFAAESQEAVKAAMPKAAHVTFAGFGHNLFWETPETVARKVTGFLNQ